MGSNVRIAPSGANIICDELLARRHVFHHVLCLLITVQCLDKWGMGGNLFQAAYTQDCVPELAACLNAPGCGHLLF